MAVYYALVVLVLLLSLLLHGERKGNKKFIFAAVLLMLCVYGLRDAYTIGDDSTSSYKVHYETMNEVGWDELPTFGEWISSSTSDGYGDTHNRNVANEWLMKIVYELTGGNYQDYIFIISLFVMLVFAHFVRRYSPSPVQSVLYYFGLIFFTFNISALKQSIAMAFVLLAFDAVVDRKLIRYLVLILVASMFHFPALIFLPAFWIASMRLDRNYLIVLVVLFVVTYCFRDQMVDWMTDAYDTTINEEVHLRFLANKVVVMLAIIAAAVVIRPPSPEDRIYCSVLLLMGVAAVIQTFAGYNNTFERLADYYFQFSFVFIPMVFENVNTKRQYLQPRVAFLIRTFAPYVFCGFAIWRFLHNTANDPTLNHYQFFFQAEQATERLISGRLL